VVWLVSRTVYDRNGRVTWQTDEHIEADPSQPETGWATRTVYDQLGRVVATERRSNALMNLDMADGFPVGVVSFAGFLVSATAQGYDEAGRLWWSENESGVRTVNVYDQYGAVEYTVKDRRHERRALSREEGRRLLAATIAGDRHHGLTGEARALLYRFALAVGFRWNECFILRRSDFDSRGNRYRPGQEHHYRHASSAGGPGD
jgi:hypothetical protein